MRCGWAEVCEGPLREVSQPPIEQRDTQCTMSYAWVASTRAARQQPSLPEELEPGRKVRVLSLNERAAEKRSERG